MASNLWQQIWEAMIGLAAIIAAIYAVLAFHYYVFSTIKSDLAKDPDYRREKAAALKNPGPWRLYRDGLDWGLGKLRLYMGLPWSWQAFAVSLLLSLSYSLLFLLIAWAFFGGPGKVGATALLPNLRPGLAGPRGYRHRGVHRCRRMGVCEGKRRRRLP